LRNRSLQANRTLGCSLVVHGSILSHSRLSASYLGATGIDNIVPRSRARHTTTPAVTYRPPLTWWTKSRQWSCCTAICTPILSAFSPYRIRSSSSPRPEAVAAAFHVVSGGTHLVAHPSHLTSYRPPPISHRPLPRYAIDCRYRCAANPTRPSTTAIAFFAYPTLAAANCMPSTLSARLSSR
jgi:hypothetical protein